MGAAVACALAFAVSVQGAPRLNGGGRDVKGKSDAERVVTGPSAHLNDVVAGAATAEIILQPIPPQVGGGYSAANITGQTLSLPAVPQRVWAKVLGKSWAPQNLKTYQAKVDSAGYMTSTCGGAPLMPAIVPCTANTQCRAVFRTDQTACALGEPSKCVAPPAWDGVGSNICEPGFQDKCASDWALTGLAGVGAVDISTLNFRYGFTTELPDVVVDPGTALYAGTLILDVPAGAKGDYVIGWVQAESFMQDDTLPVALDIPIAAYRPMTIATECGSCCTNLGPGTSVCTDNLSRAECDALPTTNTHVFRDGVTCAQQECPACLNDSDCNDGDACTVDDCVDFICYHNPKPSWDPVNECCNAVDGSEDPIISPDQCVAAACSIPPNRGDLLLTDRTGLECDDANPCTYSDTCADGAGSCAGLPAGGVACTTPADCEAATGVGYPCIDGFCYCTLTPDLDIVVLPSGKVDPECFDSGDNGAKVTAAVHVGASSSPVNGAQFTVTYDPTCLEYVSIVGAAPFTNVVYGPVVDEAAGTIFMAVGIEFGAPDGPNGNADIALLSFIKIGECNTCNICFSDINPYHTYLVDDAGQRISVMMNCSTDIIANNDVELVVPPTIKTNVDCDMPTAIETWDPPYVTDSCGTSELFCRGEHESGLVYGQDIVMGGGEFPIGVSSFCCYAVSDWCGKIVGCPPNSACADDPATGKPAGCWTVDVNDETSLDIVVQLQPPMDYPTDTLTRCLKFTLYADCINEPLVFFADVTFGGLFEFVGKVTDKIKIPGSGQWDCITAQDQLHTLRSCYTFAADGSDCIDGQLQAAFHGDPLLGGNWLIGGNLDGWKKDDPNANPSLDVIDILDFGTFVSQYMFQYGYTDTPCGTPGPNADINGDGLADMDDYAFISQNFLVSSKECCCGPETASVNAVTEVSVSQLRAMGMAELSSADLNGDGLLNLADMTAFEQGVRPGKTTPKRSSR
jgi:hypothetical protein